MEKEQILLLVMIIAVIMGGGILLAADRRRKKELKLIFDDIRPGDKYTRAYRSMYGPEEIVIDTVVIAYKLRFPSGVFMVGYEYENGHDGEPYETLLEDFLDNFERSE